MNKLIRRPDFDIEIEYTFARNEKVTAQDIKTIADELCEKCEYESGTKVLATFLVEDTTQAAHEDINKIGVRFIEQGHTDTPREWSNVGKFIVRCGGHYARQYSNPDGKHGDEIDDEIDLDGIEAILDKYTHLYSVSWNDYCNMSLNLDNKNIIPTIKKELDEYRTRYDDDQDDGSYDYYELKMLDAFKKTLEFFDDNDLFYGVTAEGYLECVDGTHPNDAPDEKVYSIAKGEVDELDRFYNEPQFGTTMDNDLDDWCYGYYNDEYGVIDQIISQCIRPMHDRGLINFVD